MTQTWDGERQVLGSRAFDELEPIGNEQFTVAVPVDADPEFKAYVYAAAVTHSQGNVSVDNVLKRNRDWLMNRFDAPPDRTTSSLKGLLRTVHSMASERIHELSTLDLRHAPIGTSAAANSLIRLASTFRAASQLIRLGFAFEAEAVIRLGYEQVAWAYHVAPMGDAEKIRNTKVEKTGTHLSAVLPGARRIYGRLSELAHLQPTTHHRFMSGGGGAPNMVGIQLPEVTRESLGFLVDLLDALLVVSETRFARFFLARKSTDATGRVLTDRPTARLKQDLEAFAPPKRDEEEFVETPASIRAELPGDVAQIERVTIWAFEKAAHTSHTEQHIIAALRRDGKLALSLVAHIGDLVVGHVALSPVSIEGGAVGWFGLGPVSVSPLHQGSGIGSRLIRAALETIRHQGALGCVVLGEPAYYGRFGFRSNPDVTLPGVPPEYFQVLPFGSAIPRGVVRYADAFDAGAAG